MKLSINQRIPVQWKTASVVGFGLTAIGLLAAVFTFIQLIPSLNQGQEVGVSGIAFILEATIGILLVMIGFALMVAGADPFEDAADQFGQRPSEEMPKTDRAEDSEGTQTPS